MSTNRNQNDKLAHILDSYKIALDIFKNHNDNYFKRVQIFMSALQVGVAVAFAKVIYPFPEPLVRESSDEYVAAAFVAFLGCFFAFVWRTLGIRQGQYLEFSRHYLRNLEGKLKETETGIPLDYFSLESEVFRLRNECKKTVEYTTAEIKFCDSRAYAVFRWITSNDKEDKKYPKSKSAFHKKAEGGMVRVELYLAFGIAITWFGIAFLCLVFGLSFYIL